MGMTTYRLALQRVCEDLSLPLGDAFTQDWAFELGESFRTASWLDRYVAALAWPVYGPGERQLLMSLVLDVANDLARVGQLSDAGWASIERTLEVHVDEYADLVEYWSLAGEQLEDCFALTPLVRAFAVSRRDSVTDRS